MMRYKVSADWKPKTWVYTKTYSPTLLQESLRDRKDPTQSVDYEFPHLTGFTRTYPDETLECISVILNTYDIHNCSSFLSTTTTVCVEGYSCFVRVRVALAVHLCRNCSFSRSWCKCRASCTYDSTWKTTAAPHMIISSTPAPLRFMQFWSKLDAHSCGWCTVHTL